MGLSVSGAASGAAAGAAFGPWGAAIGGIAGAFFGGSKAPKAVAPPTIDANKAVGDSIQANSGNFDAAAALSRRTNDFAQNESSRLLEKAIPGFGAIQAKLLDKVNEDLNSNGLPADVQQNIQRLAAERGITRGTSGGFNDFSLVKDFGFNMVDFDNAKRARALSTLSSVYGMAPRVNPMTPMASFVSPSNLLGAQQFNEQGRYAEQTREAGDDAAAANQQRSLWGGAANLVAQAAFGSAANKIAGQNDTGKSTPGWGVASPGVGDGT